MDCSTKVYPNGPPAEVTFTVISPSQAFGHDTYGGGCLDIAGTTALAVQSNALFGDGYCENNSEADNLAMTSRLRAGLNYFNFNMFNFTFIKIFIYFIFIFSVRHY